MRFPLDKKRIHGYRWGVETWYGGKHLGTDWEALFAPLYAPFDGKIISVSEGPQAGKAIQFVPRGQEPLIIRWLHLSKFLVKSQQIVKEGQQIAITGNSGSSGQASFPHSHEDIWPKGIIDIKNFKLTINPEEYWKMNNQFKTQNFKGELRVVLRADSIPTWEALCKVYGLDPKKIDEVIT